MTCCGATLTPRQRLLRRDTCIECTHRASDRAEVYKERAKVAVSVAVTSGDVVAVAIILAVVFKELVESTNLRVHIVSSASY